MNFLKRLHKQIAVLSVVFILIISSGCAFVWRFPAFQVEKSKNPNVHRGVFHVHSEFSHDSMATLKRIKRTAERAGLDFVVVTDHNSLEGREAYSNMQSSQKPLLIFGDEISTTAGHLIALGVKEHPSQDQPVAQIVEKIGAQDAEMVAAHPLSPRKPWTDWNIKEVDGMEIYSFPDVYYTHDLKMLIAKIIFLPPSLFLKNVVTTPSKYLALWDEQLQKRKRIAGFGAIDAHLKYEWMGLTPENYLLYFQAVTMYVTTETFNEKAVLDALISGKSFMAFEIRGGAADFHFSGSQGDKTYQIGDVIPEISGPISFKVELPTAGDIRLIQNGKLIAEISGTKLETKASGTGYFRVEVYQDGEIWIISNPIYVESPA